MKNLDFRFHRTLPNHAAPSGAVNMFEVFDKDTGETRFSLALDGTNIATTTSKAQFIVDACNAHVKVAPDAELSLRRWYRGFKKRLSTQREAANAYDDIAIAITEQERKYDKVIAALTPSAETKAAYIGEFAFNDVRLNGDGQEISRAVVVPWTTTKEIMAAIRKRAGV